jgi:hypothetical protein
MPLHPFAQKLLLDFLTGAATATQPSNRWISVATASPNQTNAFDGPFTFAGTAGGRQTFNCGAGVSPGGYVSNRSVMTFTGTAACTAVGWNLWDAAGGGNRLGYGTLAASVGIASAGLVTFARSTLVIQLS